MLQPFPVLLPVALLPSGRSSVRFPGHLLGWSVAGGVLYAAVVHHAGKVLGAMVAHGGRVVPPGSDTSADEEPEHAGGAAVEEDVLVGMHDSEEGCMVDGGVL